MSTQNEGQDRLGVQWKSNWIATLALVLAAISLAWSVMQDLASRPRDPTVILELIKRESQAVMLGDLGMALELFADDAVVRSISPMSVQLWDGKGQIRKRYEQLPVFKELVHVGVTIEFDPSGTYARARAGTSGTWVDSDGRLEQISSVRGEEWTFRRLEGTWKIVDFTYGLE